MRHIARSASAVVLGLLLPILVGAITFSTDLRADEPQIVILDNDHNSLSGRTTFPPPYRLKPCTSFIVDGTAFDFDLSEKFGEHVPDTLLIMVSAEQAYTVRWPHEERRVALSVATMIPLGESPPFTGF